MKNRTTAWIAILFAWILLFAACGGKTGSSAKKTQNKVKESEQLNIQKYESIAEGQTVTVEDVSSFTIESVKLTDDVVPPAPDMFYTHIPANPGRTLIDACFTYRNLRPDSTETKKCFPASCMRPVSTAMTDALRRKRAIAVILCTARLS